MALTFQYPTQKRKTLTNEMNDTEFVIENMQSFYRISVGNLGKETMAMFSLRPDLHEGFPCFPASIPEAIQAVLFRTLPLEAQYPERFSDQEYAIGFKLRFGLQSFCVAQWRRSKNVYVLDQEFGKVLLDTDLSAGSADKISTEFFRFLPQHPTLIVIEGCENVFPIGDSLLSAENTVACVGFLYQPQSVAGTRNVIIHSLLRGKNGACFIEPLKSIPITAATSVESLLTGYNVIPSWSQPNSDQILKASLISAMYVCSVNADVVARQGAAHPSGHKRKGKKPNAAATSVMYFDVGVRLGAALKRPSTTQNENQHDVALGSHPTAAPHIRRAHFHKYWAGKRDLPVRDLRVKWLPPIAVNFDADEELPVVTHRVLE